MSDATINTPSSGSRFGGFPLVVLGAVAAAGLGAGALAAGGTGVEGHIDALRATARLSAVLFGLAFVASSLNALTGWSSARWLLRNRKFLGLAFAASHLVHLGFIVSFWSVDQSIFWAGRTPVGLVVGTLGYLILLAMVVTSFDGPRRMLGGRRWKLLHTTGMYLFWLIFMFNFAGKRAAGYEPFAAILVAALVLRAAARLRR
jgi:DMSO/TMAO reductase YedYZ heme-binding membrane subunit